MQEPGEKQVSCFEHGQIVLVLHFAAGQQPGGLEIEQRRRDHQEGRGLLQVPDLTSHLHMRDELVGDLAEGDLGDVQLPASDQLKEQIERPLEVGQAEQE